MRYMSTKTYANDRGLSCAFRQWRAESHCRLLHGYALGFKFTFGADELDHRNWVVDFGGLKPLWSILEDTFDHTLLAAEDDPNLNMLKELDRCGLAKLIVLPHAGCEAFASMIFDVTEQWLRDAGFAPRCKLLSVEVFEHGANSAIATCGALIREPL